MVNKLQYKAIAISSLLLIVAVTILQDYLHAQFNHYSFYFSESVLFKSFWALFFPLAWLQMRLAKNSPGLAPFLVLLSTLLHFVGFALLVAILSTLFLGHTFAILQTLRFGFSQDLLTCLLVYGAIALLFWYNQTVPVPQTYLEKITVVAGRNNVAIATNDIILIAAADAYIAIQTNEKKFLHHDTLKSIQAKLDPNKFLRIHRSTILNIDQVHSFRSRLNGDYDILLLNQQETRLSRNYAAAFKKAMHNHTRPAI